MKTTLSAVAAATICLVALGSGVAVAATPFDPESARVPGVCGHPSTHLSGGVKQFESRSNGSSQGEVTLVSKVDSFTAPIKRPVYGAQRGSSSLDAAVVAPIRCSTGGVDHPETLVLYNRDGAILAHTYLGRFTRQEHADVTRVSLRSNHFRAHWDAFDGAGFDVHHLAATFTLRHGTLIASHIVRS